MIYEEHRTIRRILEATGASEEEIHKAQAEFSKGFFNAEAQEFWHIKNNRAIHWYHRIGVDICMPLLYIGLPMGIIVGLVHLIFWLTGSGQYAH